MPNHGLKSKGIAVNVSEKISFHGNPLPFKLVDIQSIAAKRSVALFSPKKGNIASSQRH
jgi:hypothetical protein